MLTRRAFGGAAITMMAVGAARAAASRDVVLPLNYDSGILWTSVLVEGKGPYRFYLHTGQTFFNISRKLATALALRKRSHPDVQTYTPNGKLDLQIYAAKEFILGSAYRLRDVELIARTYETEDLFPGTVPFLAGIPASFDFSRNELTFHSADFTPAPGATQLKLLPPPQGALSMTPVVQAELDGMPLKLLINTGDHHPLTLYPETVRRLGLWDRYGQGLESSQDNSETGQSRVRTVRGHVFRFAGIRFNRPVIRMENSDHPTPTQFLDADGSVGMDMLRRFSITLDHRKSAAWFTARSEILSEPFAYNRSGFGSIKVVDGTDEVLSVAPGTPAEKAGLRQGDRLALTPEASVNLWYALTLPAKTKVAFDVQRDGKIVPIHLTLEELI